jgi:NIPSNAP
MKLTWFPIFAIAALSFAAGSWITTRFTTLPKVEADSNRVYELRIYHTVPGRLPALLSRFRDHTRRIFDQHSMTSLGYWVPQDSPAKEGTLIYILSHPSRDAATKNWKEFRDDPEWQKVAKASEADGKIVEKVDSTFMEPTDFSALK